MFASTKGRVKITSLHQIPQKQTQIAVSMPAIAPQQQPIPTPVMPAYHLAPVSAAPIQNPPPPVIHQTITQNQVITQDTHAAEAAKAQALAAQKKAEECLLQAKEERKLSEEAFRVAKETEALMGEKESKYASELEAMKEQLTSIQAQFLELQKNSDKSPLPHVMMESNGLFNDKQDGLTLLLKGDNKPSSPKKSSEPGTSQQSSPRVGTGKNEWENVEKPDNNGERIGLGS